MSNIQSCIERHFGEITLFLVFATIAVNVMRNHFWLGTEK